VWQEPWLNLPYAHAAFGSAVPLAGPVFRDDYLEETSAALSGFVSHASHGIESRVRLVKATNHGTGIAAHARHTKADLIVIGRKGRTNLRYVLMGSTTEKLLTILPCSVLVVNPEGSGL
jgi:nucleotide-binding universal stress UspA family protein